MSDKELAVLEGIPNWDLLTYLRENRNWMVQSHCDRDEIEEMNGKKFTDSEWYYFTRFACDRFDNIRFEDMNGIIYAWQEWGEADYARFAK